VPKVRPKGVTDGQLVNIPALPKLDKDRWGDADRKPGAQWFQSRVKGDPDRQIRRVVCQEKPLRRSKVSVPQTDTGGREEYSKALG
jgi:hypothetical protein